MNKNVILNKKFMRNMVIIVLVAAFVCYLIVTFLYSNFSVLTTETIKHSKVADSINTNGIILREETVVTNNSSGYISYAVEDGGKVAYGGTIARLFDSQGQAANSIEKERLNSELKLLERLNDESKSLVVGIDTVDTQLVAGIRDLKNACVSGNYASLWDERCDLYYLINERQMLTNVQTDFSERISYLKNELQKYPDDTRVAGGYITADKAGFFTSAVDGYESAYEYANVKSITLDQYAELLSAKKNVPEHSIGKIITNVNWYVVCPITADQAIAISSAGTDLSISFSSMGTEVYNASVVTINQVNKQSDGVVVLSCNNMNGELSKLRNEKVTINIKYYEGLRIPKKALRTETVTKTVTDSDGSTSEEKVQTQGVYVRYGNELKFKRVSIIFSSNNYVISSKEPEDADLYDVDTVTLYDEVVTEGVDLYDGKLIY